MAGGEAMSEPGDTSDTEALGEDEDEADFASRSYLASRLPLGQAPAGARTPSYLCW